MAESHLVVVYLLVPLWDDILMGLQSTVSSTSSPSIVQLGTLPHFLDNRKALFHRFMLNMVKGHLLQLRSHPPLFCNSKQLSIKGGVTQHPVMQREADELFAKGTIEPLTGGARFYSNTFVVFKHTCGL